MNLRIFLLSLLLIPAALLAKTPITVGAAHYPPFFIFDKKGPIFGIAVEKIKRILGDEFELKWKNIPFARGEMSLNNGDIDIFLGYAKDPTGQLSPRELDYSNSPYMKISLQLCTLKSLHQNFSIKDAEGKLVVHPSGSKTSEILIKMGAKVVSIDNDHLYADRAIKLVESSRAAFFYLPSLLILGQRDPSRFSCIDFSRPYELFLTLKKNSPLTERINQALKDLSKNP